MEISIPIATEIKVEESGEYCATISGQRVSGIGPQSLFFASIQKALDEGAVVEPHIDNTDYMDMLRSKRNTLLNSCDWTQLPDVVSSGRLTSAEVAAYQIYRQVLADMPQNNPTIATLEQYNAVIWPTL